MKKPWLLCLLAIPLLFVSTQETIPPGFVQWTPIGIISRWSCLRIFPTTAPFWSTEKAMAHPNCMKPRLISSFVQSGSATLLIGGNLINGETVGPHEKRNGTIQGGIRRKLSAGDIVRIAPQVPHQVLLEGSHELNYVVLKVKRY